MKGKQGLEKSDQHVDSLVGDCCGHSKRNRGAHLNDDMDFSAWVEIQQASIWI